MLSIAEKYVKEHSISFSTDPEPRKSKTKGIIFTKKALRFTAAPLILNGNPLTWISESKYLGNTIFLMAGLKMQIRNKLVILKET